MRRFLKGRGWEFGILKIRKAGGASLDMGQQRERVGEDEKGREWERFVQGIEIYVLRENPFMHS